MIDYIVVSVILLAVLVYSTIMDLRCHELPIELFVLVIIPVGITKQVLNLGPSLFEIICMAAIVGITYLLLALFFDGGGGDVIMMTSLAICLGFRMIIIVAVATLLLLFWQIRETLIRHPVREIPYAPFVLAGFVIERIIGILP